MKHAVLAQRLGQQLPTQPLQSRQQVHVGHTEHLVHVIQGQLANHTASIYYVKYAHILNTKWPVGIIYPSPPHNKNCNTEIPEDSVVYLWEGCKESLRLRDRLMLKICEGISGCGKLQIKPPAQDPAPKEHRPDAHLCVIAVDVVQQPDEDVRGQIVECEHWSTGLGLQRLPFTKVVVQQGPEVITAPTEKCLSHSDKRDHTERQSLKAQLKTFTNCTKGEGLT